MLRGNRKVAVVVAGLIAITVTAVMSAMVGMQENVALAALGIEGAVCTGGTIMSSEKESIT